MNKQQPIDLPEIIDTPGKYSEEHTNRFVFLSHEADDLDGPIRIMQTFARFGLEGGVDIISSETNYELCARLGNEEEPSHVSQQVNLSHDEMTKLAKAWLQWLEETPESDEEPNSDA